MFTSIAIYFSWSKNTTANLWRSFAKTRIACTVGIHSNHHPGEEHLLSWGNKSTLWSDLAHMYEAAKKIEKLIQDLLHHKIVCNFCSFNIFMPCPAKESMNSVSLFFLYRRGRINDSFATVFLLPFSFSFLIISTPPKGCEKNWKKRKQQRKKFEGRIEAKPHLGIVVRKILLSFLQHFYERFFWIDKVFFYSCRIFFFFCVHAGLVWEFLKRIEKVLEKVAEFGSSSSNLWLNLRIDLECSSWKIFENISSDCGQLELIFNFNFDNF